MYFVQKQRQRQWRVYEPSPQLWTGCRCFRFEACLAWPLDILGGTNSWWHPCCLGIQVNVLISLSSEVKNVVVSSFAEVLLAVVPWIQLVLLDLLSYSPTSVQTCSTTSGFTGWDLWSVPALLPGATGTESLNQFDHPWNGIHPWGNCLWQRLERYWEGPVVAVLVVAVLVHHSAVPCALPHLLHYLRIYVVFILF